jgi:hypothetical protein
MYTGGSPLALEPMLGVVNPVLTYHDVTDVPALFAADPFMLRANDRWHLFFEIMNSHSGKGEISHAVSENGRKWLYTQRVIAEPFHLSYPYVFEWMGSHFMIPESQQDNSVRLYRASNFPAEWSFVGCLLTGQPFADASVFRYRDRWWMFVATNPDKHDVLRLYHADELLGPWLEHPMSPVVDGNPHIARPAGRVLVVDDAVIRYTQDCDPVYGLQVRAFKVTNLTTSAYEEQPASEHPLLVPSGRGWNASGMHHVDAHRLHDGRWLACVDGWIGV